MNKQWKLTLAALVVCVTTLVPAQTSEHNLLAIHVDADGGGQPRITLDADGELDYESFVLGGPDRLVIDLAGFYPGTEVTATLPDGTELTRVSRAGSSYLSSEDPRIHFGLGNATRIESLRIEWPDGRERVLTDVEVDRVLRVTPDG